MHVRLDSVDGKPVATFNLKSTDSLDAFEIQRAPLKPISPGVHTLFFVLEGGDRDACRMGEFKCVRSASR